jgi:hypothetical protein
MEGLCLLAYKMKQQILTLIQNKGEKAICYRCQKEIRVGDWVIRSCPTLQTSRFTTKNVIWSYLFDGHFFHGRHNQI